MKNQVLHTAQCTISGEAAGEIWNSSLLVVNSPLHALPPPCPSMPLPPPPKKRARCKWSSSSLLYSDSRGDRKCWNRKINIPLWFLVGIKHFTKGSKLLYNIGICGLWNYLLHFHLFAADSWMCEGDFTQCMESASWVQKTKWWAIHMLQ